MSLPILRIVHMPSPDTLVRVFHQAQHQWARHLTDDEMPLDVGIALVNRELDRVGAANRMLDVALPPDLSPAAAMEQVDAHFASRDARCRQWVFNPSAPAERTQSLEEHFRSTGYTTESIDVWVLSEPKSSPSGHPVDSIRLIPARASYRHTEMIHLARFGDDAQALTAALAHLDDPHVDALLAMRDGEAVGYVAVLAMGEVGIVEQLYAVDSSRRQGVGTMLLARAMEICARSVFKHVMAGVVPGNEPATRLLEQFGFKKIGTQLIWNSPESKS